MIQGFARTAALAALVALSGCASITGSEMQSVLVTTTEKSGAAVANSECTLESPKGLWKVTTPGSVTILRSSEDMQVTCRKDAATPGLAKLISRAHGGMFGNIIFGGGIGALIDHNKGTGYEYPNRVVVIMGEIIVLDRAREIEEEQRAAQGVPSGSAPVLSGPPPCLPPDRDIPDRKPC